MQAAYCVQSHQPRTRTPGYRQRHSYIRHAKSPPPKLSIYRICNNTNDISFSEAHRIKVSSSQNHRELKVCTPNHRVGRWALQFIDYEVLYSKSLNLTVCKPNHQIWTACTPNLRNWLPAFPIGEFEGLQSHSLNLNISPIRISDCQNLSWRSVLRIVVFDGPDWKIYTPILRIWRFTFTCRVDR